MASVWEVGGGLDAPAGAPRMRGAPDNLPRGTRASIEAVRDFWDAHPCGSAASHASGRRTYFNEIRRKRYAAEWHIPLVARFAEFRDREVLEIGCGLGTDGLEFARHGAHYTGIDVSPRSVELAREQLKLFGAEGDVLTADAANLPFPDDSFDHVYSFGVLHHVPNIEAGVSELRRVLRKGGTFCVMVYNQSSINYWVEIMVLRRLLRVALRPRFAPASLARLLGVDVGKLEEHRRLLYERPRVTRDEWLSMNTDGPGSPLSRVYSERGVLALFRDFADVHTDVWFFNAAHWPLLGRLAREKSRQALARNFGWHRMVYGCKAV